MGKVRSRYAPSPTGRMHLGNLRTALLCWLDCRARGGTLVLRMENLDRQREREGAAQQILDDLRWLGLDWDEGPDRRSPHGPYTQSERFPLYGAALEKLARAGELYPCYCTRKEIAEAASAPVAGEEGPPYPGTCAHLSYEAVQKESKPYALRFRVPGHEVRFVDRICGERRERVREVVGDFIVRRKDAVASYQLAVVLDDIAMGITDVVRGADLLGSTARQILLYEALGEKPPRYAHVPLLLGPDGRKFSKRERDVCVGTLKAAGRTPEEIVGFLAATAGVLEKGEPVRAADLIEGFELESIRKEDARVNPPALLK